MNLPASLLCAKLPLTTDQIYAGRQLTLLVLVSCVAHRGMTGSSGIAKRYNKRRVFLSLGGLLALRTPSSLSTWIDFMQQDKQHMVAQQTAFHPGYVHSQKVRKSSFTGDLPDFCRRVIRTLRNNSSAILNLNVRIFSRISIHMLPFEELTWFCSSHVVLYRILLCRPMALLDESQHFRLPSSHCF